jgi:hypothetical protein
MERRRRPYSHTHIPLENRFFAESLLIWLEFFFLFFVMKAYAGEQERTTRLMCAMPGIWFEFV